MTALTSEQRTAEPVVDNNQQEMDMANYSTYIEIYNHSEEDFNIDAPSSPTSGYWETSLPSTVKAGKTVSGHLKDKFGDTGTDSYFKMTNSQNYEVEATFECPYGDLSNKVSWSPKSNPNDQKYTLSWKSKVDSGDDAGEWKDNAVSASGEPLHVHFKIYDG